MSSARRIIAIFSVVAALTFASLGRADHPSAAEPARFTPTPLAADRLDGTGLAVLQVGPRVYVGGTFDQVRAPDGHAVGSRANLAAFDVATGRLLDSFRADTNGAVRSLATDGTHLFVGGSFTSIGSMSRGRVASLDLISGTVDPVFRANANSNVYSLAVSSSRLVIGGSFSWIGGQARSRFAVIDRTSGAAQAPAPQFDGTVLAVGASQDGAQFFAGGGFAKVGTTAQRWSAVLDADGSLASTQLADIGGPVSVFRPATDGQTVAVSQLGLANAGGRWRLADGRRLWRQRCDGDGQAVDELDGTVYSGFHEGCERDGTIRLTANDATTGVRDNGFGPAFDRFWGVFAIDAAPSALAIAGDFTSVGGVPAQGFALFPSSTAPAPPPTTTVAPTTQPSTTLPPTTTTVAAPTTTTIQPPPPPGGTLPVTMGSSWRYHDGADAVAVTWTQPSFADSGWPQGPGELGYGEGDEATTLSFGPDAVRKPVTTYFHRTITVGTVPGALRMSLTADDGAAVYLNGAEVLRDNLPAGALTADTLAVTNRSGPGESKPRHFTIAAASLHPGGNVIAVEVHQDAPNSSDLSFDLGIWPA